MSGYRIGRRVLITRRYAARVVDAIGVIATCGERDFEGLGDGLRSKSGTESDGIPPAERVTSEEIAAVQSRHGAGCLHVGCEEGD